MDNFSSIGPLACMISEANLNFSNVNSKIQKGQ